MSCPYFDEGCIGTCSASVSQYIPSIDTMETYCFKETYRLCPALSEYLFENDMSMANRKPTTMKVVQR